MKNEKKFKLCIVIGAHWAHTFGGSQYQVRCLVNELIQDGRFDIYFLARGVNPNYTPHGYKIIKIGSDGWLGKFGLAFDSKDLYRKLVEIKPDVIYQRVYSPYTGVCAYYAGKTSCKFIWHVSHDGDVRPGTLKLSKKLLTRPLEPIFSNYGRRHTDIVITQTNRQKWLLEENFGVKTAAVISNFHPSPAEQSTKLDGFRVVWIGNFKPIKRPEIFLQLAKDLVDLPDIQFEMIGRMGNMREYGKLHEAIRQQENLEYCGEKSQDEVNAVLASSHLFVNTSTEEGMPNTFIQAWMRGVPVLSLDVDIDGILAEGQCGYLALSYDNLKDCLVQLAQNRLRVSEMADRGIEMAERRFSLSNARSLIEIMAGRFTKQ